MAGQTGGQIKKNELSWKFNIDNRERLIFTAFSFVDFMQTSLFPVA